MRRSSRSEGGGILNLRLSLTSSPSLSPFTHGCSFDTVNPPLPLLTRTLVLHSIVERLKPHTHYTVTEIYGLFLNNLLVGFHQIMYINFF